MMMKLADIIKILSEGKITAFQRIKLIRMKNRREMLESASVNKYYTNEWQHWNTELILNNELFRNTLAR